MIRLTKRFRLTAALGVCVLSFLLSAPAAFAATISGGVTDTGGPLSGITVYAWHYYTDTGDWRIESSAATVSNGSYSVTGLEGGDYVVQFVDASRAHVNEFYNDVATPSATDTRNHVFSLAAGGSSGAVNAVLATGGSIAGQVTAESGGAKLPGIAVKSFVQSSEISGLEWVEYSSTTTNANGDYALPGLPEGPVRLRFSGTGYTTEMHFNIKTSDPNDARCTQVDVDEALPVTGLNAALAATVPVGTGSIKGVVAGSVSGGGTVALEGALVEAFFEGPSGIEFAEVTVVLSDGSYTLAGLAPGTYRLRFSTSDGAYLTECYDNIAGTNVLDAACTGIPVGEDETVGSKNAILTPAARITGAVTEHGSGATLDEITVSAYRWNSSSSSWALAGSATSGESTPGFYEIGWLTAGTYRLKFTDANGDYETECWDDAHVDDISLAEVDSFGVASGELVPSKAAALTRITPPPVPADAYEDDDSLSSARLVTLPCTESHSIDALGDADWIRLNGATGVEYTIGTSGAELLDTRVQVYDAAGNLLADEEDDVDFASLTYAPPANGALCVRVSAKYTGYYTLGVTAVDKQAPVTTSNAVASYVSQATIALSASDNYSGVNATYYRLDGGPWSAGTSTVVAALGAHTLEFYSTDKAGNAESAKSTSFTVAAPTAPVITKTRVSVGAPVAPKTMKAKKGYSVYGPLKPRHTAGSKPVWVYKYKKVSGKWKKYGYVKATASNSADGHTRYKVKMSLPSKGSWRLRAYAPGDTDHLATWSAKYDYVTVK
ncbi:MAG TPA: carboxypeptidase regulatory-like domain-containing protein [Coriobacteriia bacterium]|nr:carboxypeptidase regulatory-like domain-containing protein [Coriobacteriia bacterium]